MIESSKILIVDDEVEYRETYKILLEGKGFFVGEASSVQEALEILEREYYPIVLSDVIMPGKDGFYLLNEIKKTYRDAIEVIIVTGYGSIESAVKAMKIGALGYFIKSRNPEELFSEIEKAKRFIKLETQNNLIKKEANSKVFLHQTKSPKMLEVLKEVEVVSQFTSNILLTGETGVGKEVIASLIHQKSKMSKELFVPINCQAISDSLLESELFGHEKGSFTGATSRRIGRFEEANGGTIFLDEIGEMSLNTQVKILRVLDTRQIERIGSNKQIKVNFRLISATNRNLHKEIELGNFREDLFYRINTINIEIPPLRERKEDLKGMIDFFIMHFSNEMKKNIKGIDKNTEQYLLEYDYPGNVRELRNIIERIVVLSTDGILRLNTLGSTNIKEKTGKQNKEIISFKKAREQFEIEYIKDALEKCDNNITRAANAMGISRRQLFNKLVEYNLNR
ncbi:DNA-binding transcriptional response regulator, NtrC family, contains REC, AAA-type ATPase, and a Fis-type DNA-binding domains [Geosporobacter subterraneus DSM 17957]|uniref:Stage 0 sporulation protein A homolog n=1 Tax=Geosporobacter subterraneus DSM 17957 TaxID=1121919 RepID=A0A1M6QLW9_9FIRM|nr:sigma-54 dependent transcriptional regulator [Geosporobacter subterraneus]SHK21216.1 DNA-binding transcriptional response regulator, NtrC family, contains REC, AAA-type ATPase, and a Fis-type DNA-binding domains [Geosporobacter subterraneus DSM 17957]